MNSAEREAFLSDDFEVEAADAVDATEAAGQHAQRRQRQRRTFLAAAALAAGLALLLAIAGGSGEASMREHPAARPGLRVAPGGVASASADLCSAAGTDCSSTKCCTDAGHACFEKTANWAECRTSCIAGPDPRSPDNYPWSCTQLGNRTQGQAPSCSKLGEDCSSSKCCDTSGTQCYAKADGYATCKADCTKGLDLSDTDPTPWSCEALGPRTPDVAPWVWSKCAATNADCSKSQCCNTVGMQCYMKDQYYGTCMPACDPNAPATTGWSCETRGQRLMSPAPKPSPSEGKPAKWVADYCAAEGEDCRKSTCCATPGMQCFEKNATFSGCKASCSPGPDLYDSDRQDWSCKELGPRTPGLALEPFERRKHVAPWVDDVCAKEFAYNCRSSKCCREVGNQCYAKNDGWAACMPDCTPGPRKGDEGNWTCAPLGPRRHRAYPSLYCLAVMQPFGYEPPLIKAQIPTGHGIWGCDQFDVYSTKEIEVGEVPGHGMVKTQTFVPAVVGRSKDYTAANAELFMHVWDAVSRVGKWKLTDFTVKVDPDAVLLPTRLRQHLDPFNGKHGYVVNCAKPYMPEGPMMFGALEVFTKSMLETYFPKAKDCATGLPWQQWGEDLYMGKCLEKLGGDRLNDFSIYSDGVCNGVDCGDPVAAAFHPKKDIGSWMACLEQTHHPHDTTSTEAPQWFKDYMKVYAR